MATRPPQPTSARKVTNPEDSDDARLAEAAARLVHDVGKYMTRTARNLRPGDYATLGPALRAMLISDLYGTATADRSAGTETPHARFLRLVAPFSTMEASPGAANWVAGCRDLFGDLDALRDAVLRGDADAAARAGAVALAIDAKLRDLAAGLQQTARGTKRAGKRERR